VDGVDEQALSKLTAAGLVTVAQLRMASPEEVVAVSGLDAAVVDRLLAAVAPKRDEARADSAQNVVELPLQPDRLRSQLEGKLRAQVDAEAALDEVQAQIHRLRVRTAALAEEIESAEREREELQRELARAEKEVAESLSVLADARAERDDMAKKNALAEEALHAEEHRLGRLREAHRNARAEQNQFDEEVEGLLERLERMLETAQRW
jgi:chromosome segregation ATPase